MKYVLNRFYPKNLKKNKFWKHLFSQVNSNGTNTLLKNLEIASNTIIYQKVEKELKKNNKRSRKGLKYEVNINVVHNILGLNLINFFRFVSIWFINSKICLVNPKFFNFNRNIDKISISMNNSTHKKLNKNFWN